MWATLQHPPWNVPQCVCTRSCLCFKGTTAGMWLSCAWMCVCVRFSVGISTTTMLTCMRNENTAGMAPFIFFGHTCITLPDAKINVSHISVRKIQCGCLWMFVWLTHWSSCDTLTPWALSCQRLLLSLLALTNTSHHSPDRCPEASLVLTQPNPALGPRALFWELKSHNCRADSDS